MTAHYDFVVERTFTVELVEGLDESCYIWLRERLIEFSTAMLYGKSLKLRLILFQLLLLSISLAFKLSRSIVVFLLCWWQILHLQKTINILF
ncbi:hypothetical protein D3C86_2069680 [compost metagenome]